MATTTVAPVSRKWYHFPNIISRIGGRWDDVPDGYADFHGRSGLGHAENMRDVLRSVTLREVAKETKEEPT